MEWLNYHHLHYFWVVSREGTITKAAEVLHLTQPTISEQLKTFEASLGEDLFDRSGRRLALTDTGRLVYRYADEIFSLGQELQDTLAGRPSGRPTKLRVGFSDVVPKLVLHRLIEPALRMREPAVQVVCREDKTERLLAELSVSDLDLVIADAPLAGQARVRAFNHLLGECGVTFFATAKHTRGHRREFPASLDGAPLLLPTENTAVAVARGPREEARFRVRSSAGRSPRSCPTAPRLRRNLLPSAPPASCGEGGRSSNPGMETSGARRRDAFRAPGRSSFRGGSLSLPLSIRGAKYFAPTGESSWPVAVRAGIGPEHAADDSPHQRRQRQNSVPAVAVSSEVSSQKSPFQKKGAP